MASQKSHAGMGVLRNLLRAYNPWLVSKVMALAKEGNYTVEAAVENTAFITHDAESFARGDTKIQELVTKRERALQAAGKTSSPTKNAMALAWILVWHLNRWSFIGFTFLAIVFLCLRLLNMVFFAQLMGVLAGKEVDLLFVQPSVASAVACYLVAAIGQALANYSMDTAGKLMGMRVRPQLLYSINSTSLRNTMSSLTSRDITPSEAVLMSGFDLIWIYQALTNVVYIVVLPIEACVLIALTCKQLGVGGGFIALIPICFFFALKLIITKITFTEQNAARTIASQRFGRLEEGINANNVVKFMGLEDDLMNEIVALRKKEQKKLWWFTISNASSLWIQLFLAPFSAWVAMYSSEIITGTISSRAVQTVLGYFKTLTGYDVYKFVDSVQNVGIGYNCMARQYRLYAGAATVEDTREPLPAEELKKAQAAADPNAPLVLLKNASFAWKPTDEPVVKNVNLRLPRGKLIGVVGPVGCGKTSFLLSLLGETHRAEGDITKHPDWLGRVAYMPQKRWLLTGTVRTNIQFAEVAPSELPMAVDQWIGTVVDGCGLVHDLESFPDGLDHFIGEAGSSLSGGQRARLALARAVYSQSAVTILDDPLCALDPALAVDVFNKVIAPGGLLHGPGRSVILVTAAPSFLERCDEVIVVDEGGKITGSGSLNQIKALIRPGTLIEPSKKVMFDSVVSRRHGAGLARTKAVRAASSPGTRRYGRLVTFQNGEDEEMELVQDLNLKNVLYCGGVGADLDLVREDKGLGTYLDDDDLDAKLEESDDDYEGLKAAATGLGDLAATDCQAKELVSGVDVKLRGYISSMVYMLGWRGLLMGGSFIIATQGFVYAWQVLIKQWLGVEEPDYRWAVDMAGYWTIPIILMSALGAFTHFFDYLFASTYVQNKCSEGVIRAPYSFFAVNAAGRIYGNISQDAQSMERTMTQSLGTLWFVAAQILGTMVLTCMSLPYMIVLYLGMYAFYFWVFKVFSRTDRPAVAMEALARGPVQAHAATTIQGLAVARAFQQHAKMRAIQAHNVRMHTGALFTLYNLTSWLQFQSNVIINGIMTIVPVILLSVVLEPSSDSLGPVILSNIMSLSGVIGQVAGLMFLVEFSLIGAQRMVLYAEVPNEVTELRPTFNKEGPGKRGCLSCCRRRAIPAAATNSGKDDSGSSDSDLEDGKAIEDLETIVTRSGVDLTPAEVPKDWPSAGAIEYRNTYASYRWSMPPILKGLNISIPAGSSCAFIGRSGSGKSTAFLALSGMIPVTGGSISVDGISVSRIAIKRLRAALAVVPQDPVLFSGTLRINLDPFNTMEDETLWSALRCVHLEDLVRGQGGLSVDPVASGMSQGQLQLLCLARAMLRDTQILLLDEANSSVDKQTEELMNKIVARFAAGEISASGNSRRRTVVEVAHRLAGVVARDQVVVLRSGEIIEKGVPAVLAKTEGSEFHSMITAQGVEVPK